MTDPADPRAREEFDLALTRTIPDLPESERAALWECWGHLRRWVARLPRELPFEAEPAHIFSAPERQP
ncbi:MAG TPA: hypothetical protein VKU84_16025 [Stellaceae bacterium]|nr:hypothetical protein [Stellaceae bacterium]